MLKHPRADGIRHLYNNLTATELLWEKNKPKNIVQRNVVSISRRLTSTLAPSMVADGRQTGIVTVCRNTRIHAVDLSLLVTCAWLCGVIDLVSSRKLGDEPRARSVA